MAQPKDGYGFTLSGRIRHVRLALAPLLGGYIGHGRFGAIVAEEAGEPRPFHLTTAKRWEEGAEPSLHVLGAITDVARKAGLNYVTRVWLAYGKEGVDEAMWHIKVPFPDGVTGRAPEPLNVTETTRQRVAEELRRALDTEATHPMAQEDDLPPPKIGRRGLSEAEVDAARKKTAKKRA